MRRCLVAANWKMHGEATQLARMLRNWSPLLSEERIEVALFPPLAYIAQVHAALSEAASTWSLGGQDLSRFPDSGPYTGEVSARMLADNHCRYVIIGHSERRRLFGEGPEVIGAKLRCAAEAGLTPMLCVGETVEEREAGASLEVVSEQLNDALAALDGYALRALLVAYEPVWAIGSGETPTLSQVQSVQAGIRQHLAARGELARYSRLLYGGSVNADNAGQWLEAADVDGMLVGGASLDPVAFHAICEAALRVSAGQPETDSRAE